jgi:hypothetical protein
MITFIAVAYKETTEAMVFLSSLIAQTNTNWKCIVYCDAPNEYIKNLIDTFNDSRISYHQNETAKGYWGHYNREYALQNLVDTEFVIQTSIQDYYCPIAVDEILRFTDRHNFIYFNGVSHLNHGETLNTEPKRERIDWGNFAVKTEIAKRNGINNLESPICDGLFVEECFSNHPIVWFKSNKVLTFHN